MVDEMNRQRRARRRRRRRWWPDEARSRLHGSGPTGVYTEDSQLRSGDMVAGASNAEAECTIWIWIVDLRGGSLARSCSGHANTSVHSTNTGLTVFWGRWVGG